MFEYSRIDSVQFIASGKALSRPIQLADDTAMERLGDTALVVRLSGFIFFGLSDHVVQRIRKRLAAPATSRVQVVIVDLHRVSGIDSSAIMSFSRLARLARRLDKSIALAGLGDPIAERFRIGGVDLAASPFHREPTVATAATWALERSSSKSRCSASLRAGLDLTCM